MVTDTYRIMSGTCGWLHESWKESFYPEDLPEEWRLGYYGNEFPIVMFPAEYWEFDDETIQEWLEESGENLQFVCEFASLEQLELNRLRLPIFADRCSGIVCKVDVADFSLDELDKIEACGLPVCIDTGGDDNKLDSAIQEELHTRHVGLVWHGGESTPEFGDCPLALTRVNSHSMDMRILRQVLETLLAQTVAEQSVVLIFDGKPPLLDSIHNAVVMLDLID